MRYDEMGNVTEIVGAEGRQRRRIRRRFGLPPWPTATAIPTVILTAAVRQARLPPPMLPGWRMYLHLRITAIEM